MSFDHSFEILSTPVQTLSVCTTGISSEEKNVIRSQLPKHVILEDVLTSMTNYLVTYKAVMTKKYIQALKWNIKILHVGWLYNTNENIKKYEMFLLDGMCFAAADGLCDMIANYCCFLGATQSKYLNVTSSFFIGDSDTNEDGVINFCREHEIPIVSPKNVFGCDYDIYWREARFDAVESTSKLVFDERVFFLDPEIPRVLFNHLRRMIIENGGTRVSSIDKDVEFILTHSYEKFSDYEGRVYYYQYVFDCVETKMVLLRDQYRVYFRRNAAVLDKIVCCVDPGLGDEVVNVSNKLKALGSIVRPSIDRGCTHFVVGDKRKRGKNLRIPYKVVLYEWVDQCLYKMKYVNEDRYLVKLDVDGSERISCRGKSVKSFLLKRTLFQFTGLLLSLRKMAIEKLEKLNVEYSNSDEYERCTHLIMGTVNTSEKFLSCLCNGGWILKPNVIDDFDGTSDFDFSKYEWAADECFCEKDKRIVSAIKKWRERVRNCGRPAFYRWVVKLYCEEKKRNGYVRVIENGGGISTTSDEYTHCFVSKHYEGIVPDGKKHSTDYIFSYLFQ